MNGEKKFLFDEMLRNLASWCRILGIYSEWLSGRNDSQLLDYARKNGLIFVTRDVQLSLRCEKAGVKCVSIHSQEIEEQIVQVLRETGVKISFPEKTRCASCNGELDIVGKDAVKELPANVLEHHEKFWKCKKCGKVFWEGGHWNNIRRIYGKVQEILGKAAAGEYMPAAEAASQGNSGE